MNVYCENGTAVARGVVVAARTASFWGAGDDPALRDGYMEVLSL